MSIPMIAVASVLVSLALLLGSLGGPSDTIGWYGESLETRTTSALGPRDTDRPLPSNDYGVAGGGEVASVTGGRLGVRGEPSIDLATVRRVLRQYNSPAIGDAEAFIELGRQYGIDPAICLAFFIVESGAGTRGVATETRSVGNIRATPGYVNYKGYRKYATWRDGIDDWYRLISRLYIGDWKLTSVEEIVPVYAPAGDGNDPAHYADTVRRLVTQWRSGR